MSVLVPMFMELYNSVAVMPVPVVSSYPAVACPESHVGCRLGRELFSLPT